jgi:hypothetical protein
MSPIKNQNASRFSFLFFSHFEHQTREMYKSADYPPRVAGAAVCAGISLKTRFFDVFFYTDDDAGYMGVGCVCVHAAQQLMI